MPWESLISALAGVAATAIPAWFAYRARVRALKMQVEAREREMDIQRRALSRADSFVRDAAVYSQIQLLTDETEIDRVLLLTAWNGKFSPQWTTAIWQYRAGDQTQVSYIHTPLDADYQDRLRDIEEKRYRNYVVSDMPDCLTRGIYESEGVKAAAWVFLNAQDGDDDSRQVTYMSFATHKSDQISPATIARCQVLAGMLGSVTTH